MSFIDVPFTSDADSLKQDALDVLIGAGWTPADGDPEVVLLEALAPAAQNAIEVAAQMPAEAFEALGVLYGVPFLAAAPAEAISTWALVDDGAAHTIPAGTVVQIGGVFLATVSDTAVSAHTTSVALVLLRAVDDGAAANGFVGAAQLVNSLAFVNTVTLTSTSSGGVDAEDQTGYLDRLRDEIQAAGPPVTDADYAVKAIATPSVGIGRATAQTTAARTVTVAVTDINGNPLTSDDKTAISAYLEAKREVNFVVTVADADYNFITVTYSYALAAGYVAATVTAAISATLRAFLSPAIWGALPATDPASKANAWSNTTTVYISVITALIQNTPGVAHVGTVKINGSTSDYALTGTAPLPSVPADLSFSGHTNTSTSITSIATADTANLKAHMAITGTGIPAATTISSVSSTSIVISNAATATATVTLAASAMVPTVL